MTGLFGKKKKEIFKTTEMLEEFRGEDGDGLHLLQQNKFDEALQYFDNCLKKYPRSVYYIFGKALALSYLGRPEDSIRYYDGIIETFDNYLEKYWFTAADLFEVTFTSLYNKIQLYHQIGKESEARICYEKALECIDYLLDLSKEKPYDGLPDRLWIFKARVCAVLQKNEEALDCLQKAVEISKSYGVEEFSKFKEQFLNEWAEDFRELKRYPSLSRFLGFCVNCGSPSLTKIGVCNCGQSLAGIHYSGPDADPSDTRELNLKAVALIEINKNKEAIECLDKVLEIDPNYIAALNNKSTALCGLGNYKDALDYSERAIAIDPNYVLALNNKAFALYGLERYKEAIEYNDKSLAINPTDPDVLTGKGRSLVCLKRYHEAISWFEKALEVDPNFVLALNSIGTTHMEFGEYGEAIEWYDKALAIAPRYFLAIINKTAALISLKRYEEVIEYCDKALEVAPNYSEAIMNKGFALGKLGRHREQDEWFAKASRI